MPAKLLYFNLRGLGEVSIIVPNPHFAAHFRRAHGCDPRAAACTRPQFWHLRLSIRMIHKISL